MAWSSAELSADELAWAAADKPMVLAQSHLRDADAVVWRDLPTAGGSDLTDSDYPESRLSDGYTDLLSQPSTAGAWRYVRIDFGSAGVAFDTVAILNHTLVTSGYSRIQIAIADDLDFTSNVQIISDDSSLPSTDRRIVYPELYHTGSVARRYSTVRYAYVGFYDAGSDKPEVGEIIFSQRRQLKTRPFGMWDQAHLRNYQTEIESLGGVRTRYVRAKGARVLEAQYTLHEAARVSDMLAIWESDSDYGTHPFLWVETPAAAPHLANLMLWDESMRRSPMSGPYARSFVLRATEQGPHFLELDP